MKNWMVILILALAGGVWGQGGMLLVGGAAAPPPPAQLLLDEYPGAAAAYSLRKLRAGYTGNCIQVRRSDTNALADIGFLNNYLDTVGLKAFCPVGVNCFVRTWYDQSVNNNHAQETTNSMQPQIVINGNLIILNSLASIEWSGNSGMKLTCANLNGSISYTIASVFSGIHASQFTKLLSIGPDATNQGVWFTVNTANASLEWQFRDTGFSGNGYNNLSGPSLLSNQIIIPNNINIQNVLTTTLSNSNALMYKNGLEIGYRIRRTGNCHNLTGNLIIGNSPNINNTFNGRIQELVIWQLDISTSLPGINSNINSKFNTY